MRNASHYLIIYRMRDVHYRIFISILTLMASTGKCEALSYLLTKNPAKSLVCRVHENHHKYMENFIMDGS